MCGRFTLFEATTILSKDFDTPISVGLPPRYNIAPSQQVVAVRTPLDSGKSEFAWLRWDLIPHWAKDSSIGNRMINARADTLAEKPAFRDAFKRRRCLIPANGFFEWKKEGRRKQPYYIRMQDGHTFSIARLWEMWKGPDDSLVESCTLITTAANDLVTKLHDRMPVIVAPAAYDLWLDPESQDRDRLTSVLQPFPADEMEAYPVGLSVNNPKTDDSRCIAPMQL